MLENIIGKSIMASCLVSSDELSYRKVNEIGVGYSKVACMQCEFTYVTVLEKWVIVAQKFKWIYKHLKCPL